MVKDRAVKFGDNIGTTLVLRYDDEGTEISCTHLAIERLLDSGISDEDEVTKFEVIVDDGGSMLLFEMDHGFDLSSVHVGGKCCKVRPMFLEGDSMPSNKVGRGKRSVGWRKQIGCFSNVEGHKRMCASSCKVQGAAHTSVDSDSVGPHNRSDDGVPP